MSVGWTTALLLLLEGVSPVFIRPGPNPVLAQIFNTAAAGTALLETALSQNYRHQSVELDEWKLDSSLVQVAAKRLACSVALNT